MAGASAKIDWLTFTIWPIHPDENATLPAGYYHARALESAVYAASGLAVNWSEPVHLSRAPYNRAVKLDPAGVLMYCELDGSGLIAERTAESERPDRRFDARGLVLYATVELSGQDCQHLGHDTLLGIMRRADKISRIDIAVDIETATLPADVAAAGYSNRIRSRSSIASETGLTEYFGSMKSDRFLRVYRYTGAEHDRVHLLRFEFVQRGDYAKATADRLLTGDIDALARFLLARFGMAHECLSEFLAGEHESLTVESRDRAALSRFHWLMTQVRPSLFQCTEGELASILGGLPLPDVLLREHALPF